jgi:xanthine dehydrogenase accessory factor
MNDLLEEMTQALAKGETVTLMTVIETGHSAVSVGNKRLIYADGRRVGSLGNPLLDAAVDREALYHASRQRADTLTLWSEKFLSPEAAVLVQSESIRARILFETIRPQPCLLICGAGHIGRALAQIGLILGFRAVVIDDRAEFASRAYFPDTHIELRAQPFVEAVQQIRVTDNTSIVIVTRGHKHDEDCLRLLLDSSAQYIGMIGSRRRVAVVIEKLQGEGFSKEQLGRIYAPIGLDIGARTPEEIALTILAEIILIRNRGKDQTDCRPLSRKKR